MAIGLEKPAHDLRLRVGPQSHNRTGPHLLLVRPRIFLLLQKRDLGADLIELCRDLIAVVLIERSDELVVPLAKSGKTLFFRLAQIALDHPDPPELAKEQSVGIGINLDPLPAF